MVKFIEPVFIDYYEMNYVLRGGVVFAVSINIVDKTFQYSIPTHLQTYEYYV